MSHAYYSTRLYWTATGGIAKLRGRLVQLSAPPSLCGEPVDGVDYAPEAGCAQVLPVNGGWREMTADEVKAADAFLVATVEAT